MLSRRSFMNSTIGAGAGVALAAQGPQPAAAQRGPRRRIIVDAQAHIWKMHTPERPWPADGIGQAHIPRPFSYYELLARMDEAGVDRVVIVPPSWEGVRNEYAMEAAKKWPRRFAVMGRLRLDDPKSREALATWKDQPGMLGIRHTFNRMQTGWLTDGTADWFWPAAVKVNMPVMVATSGHERAMKTVLDKNPDLALIVDHLSLSDLTAREGRIPEVISQVVEWAKFPNVCAKMSSVPHKSAQAYPFRDMTEHLKRVFDAYGPRRCFWGTDLTAGIDKFPDFTYQQRITHFTEELPFLSEEDKDWVMGRAIMRRLGWA